MTTGREVSRCMIRESAISGCDVGSVRPVDCRATLTKQVFPNNELRKKGIFSYACSTLKCDRQQLVINIVEGAAS